MHEELLAACRADRDARDAPRMLTRLVTVDWSTAPAAEQVQARLLQGRGLLRLERTGAAYACVRDLPPAATREDRGRALELVAEAHLARNRVDRSILVAQQARELVAPASRPAIDALLACGFTRKRCFDRAQAHIEWARRRGPMPADAPLVVLHEATLCRARGDRDGARARVAELRAIGEVGRRWRGAGASA